MAIRKPEVIASINAANKSLTRKKKELSKLGVPNRMVRNNITVKNPAEFKSVKEANKYLKDVETFKSNNKWVKNRYGAYVNKGDVSAINKIITENNKMKGKFAETIVDKPTLMHGKETNIKTGQSLRTTLYDQKRSLLMDTRKVTVDSFRGNYQAQNRLKGAKNRNEQLKKEFSKSKGSGKQGLKKQEQSSFMQNYLKGLKHQLDEKEISKKDYYEMRKLIRSMSNSQFTEWFYREEGTESVFLYSMDEMDVLLQQQMNKSLMESLRGFIGE